MKDHVNARTALLFDALLAAHELRLTLGPVPRLETPAEITARHAAERQAGDDLDRLLAAVDVACPQWVVRTRAARALARARGGR